MKYKVFFPIFLLLILFYFFYFIPDKKIKLSKPRHIMKNNEKKFQHNNIFYLNLLNNSDISSDIEKDLFNIISNKKNFDEQIKLLKKYEYLNNPFIFEYIADLYLKKKDYNNSDIYYLRSILSSFPLNSASIQYYVSKMKNTFFLKDNKQLKITFVNYKHIFDLFKDGHVIDKKIDSNIYSYTSFTGYYHLQKYFKNIDVWNNNFLKRNHPLNSMINIFNSIELEDIKKLDKKTLNIFILNILKNFYNKKCFNSYKNTNNNLILLEKTLMNFLHYIIESYIPQNKKEKELLSSLLQFYSFLDIYFKNPNVKISKAHIKKNSLILSEKDLYYKKAIITLID